MAPTKPPSDSKTPYKDILSTISTGVKKSTFRPLRARVDLDKCCGVAGDGSASEDVTASPCPKPLRGCQVHSKAQKRAVTGRSCSYDMLIIPAWTSSPRVHGPDVDNGEGSSKGVTKAEVRGREPHFYIGEMSPKVEIPVSKKGGNGKEKATSKDSKEKTLVDVHPHDRRERNGDQRLGLPWRMKVCDSVFG